jgi:hypothetical protein
MAMFENFGVFIRENVWLENSLSQMSRTIFEPNLFPYKYSNILNPSHSSYLPACEDGTGRVFRNVGIQNSDAGELPRRKHTTFRKRRKFEIKNLRSNSKVYFLSRLWLL